MARTLPFQLGRFTLFDHIGRGGMADIYLARTRTDLGATRLVVIKEVIPLLAENERFNEMLIQEAKVAAGLHHANISRVEDLGRYEGVPYIAMEYVEGIDLRQLLRLCSRRKVPLPIGYSLGVMCEVLKALDYAHRFKDDQGRPRPIVHRDVSPSNVLLSFDGEVKLCDFGIASAVVAAEAVPAATIEGKAGYMSPEHARGEPVDGRADIFAAGIMVWELLNGRRLYKKREGMTLLEVAREAEIAPLVMRGLPEEEELHAIVQKALAREPASRYQSAGRMMRDIERYCVQAQLLSSSIRFGGWLSDHFAEDRVERRRARQRALLALDVGPPLRMVPLPADFKDELEPSPEPPGAEPPDEEPPSERAPGEEAPFGKVPSSRPPSSQPASSRAPSARPPSLAERPRPEGPGAMLALVLGSGALVFGLLWLLRLLGVL